MTKIDEINHTNRLPVSPGLGNTKNDITGILGNPTPFGVGFYTKLSMREVSERAIARALPHLRARVHGLMPCIFNAVACK